MILSNRLGSGHAAVTWLCVEAALVICQALCRRGFEVAESFLGTLLGHRVNVMILEKVHRFPSCSFILTHFHSFSIIFNRL